MYAATVYNVMVVSPGDVIQERDILRDLVYEWNDTNSGAAGKVLLPLGWEHSVYPLMGDRPQGIINKQILEDADLLIGVFWTRLGTSTGKAVSGSVEEIEEHMKAGKPTMLYFSNQPAALQNVDQDQFAKLSAFKENMRKKGVVHEYDSASSFTDLARKHLSKIVLNHAYFGSSGAPEPPAKKKEAADEYRAALTEEAHQLLYELSQDRQGHLLKLYFMGGFRVQTNGKGFGSDNNEPRVLAALEDALQTLERYGLIEAADYKRQVFRITAKGYKVADALGPHGV